MSADAPSSSVRAVAVVTRTIGRPLLLRRARMSVAAQRFRDLVWVVVNDGGDPRAVEDEITAARAAGLDAAVLHRETRGGMESAANLGIRASQSRYVAIHDDDDSWQPGFLAATVAALDSDAGFVGAVTRCVTVIEEIEGERILTLDRRPQNPWLRALHLADLAVRNLYPPIAFLYRREAYERVGGYDESLPVLGDWDFNLKLALAGEIRVIPETLAHYHVRVGGGPDYANTITANRICICARTRSSAIAGCAPISPRAASAWAGR
jgi:GT2 family glycosyltransferase